MDKVILYTDGGCRPNPGAGAWAAVVISNEGTQEVTGFDPDTTNIRMETKAVIEGLKVIPRPSVVDLYTDSTYVINAITNRTKWVRKKELPNKDLVSELYALCDKHTVSTNWVRGHSGDELNERCDFLVNKMFWSQDVSGNSSS